MNKSMLMRLCKNINKFENKNSQGIKETGQTHTYIFYKRRYFALLSMTAFDLNFAMNQNDFVILNIVKDL